MLEKKSNKKDKTHRLIIEKSAELFNQKGYAGTSLSDIMKATGLKKGGIYGHFSNKKEIAIASFEYLADILFTKFNMNSIKDSTSIEKLYIILDYHQRIYKNDILIGGCPLLNVATEADDTYPDLLERVMKYVEKWRKLIFKIVKDGLKKKEINPIVDPDEFASTYIAIIEGGNFLSKVYNDPTYRIKAIDRLKKIIENEFVY